MTESKILTLTEAAAFLRSSPNTVRELLRDGRIPAKKVGRSWRVTEEALVKWLEAPVEPVKKKRVRRQ